MSLWINIYLHFSFLHSSRCDGLSNCVVPVESSHFPDSCPGTSKYLEIHYACISQSKSSGSQSTNQLLPPWLQKQQEQQQQQQQPILVDSSSSVVGGRKVWRKQKNGNGNGKSNGGGVPATPATTPPAPRKPILVTEKATTKETTTTTTAITVMTTTTTTTTPATTGSLSGSGQRVPYTVTPVENTRINPGASISSKKGKSQSVTPPQFARRRCMPACLPAELANLINNWHERGINWYSVFINLRTTERKEENLSMY